MGRGCEHEAVTLTLCQMCVLRRVIVLIISVQDEGGRTTVPLHVRARGKVAAGAPPESVSLPWCRARWLLPQTGVPWPALRGLTCLPPSSPSLFRGKELSLDQSLKGGAHVLLFNCKTVFSLFSSFLLTCRRNIHHRH